MTLEDLERDLLALRKNWPNNWLGLPQIISVSLGKLGYASGDKISDQNSRILSCILKISSEIESSGYTQNLSNNEPAYHNRLHIADVVNALTCLILANRNATKNCNQIGNEVEITGLSHQEWLAMLCIVGHDFHHSGLFNEFPSQIEIDSTKQLLPFLESEKLSTEDQEWIVNAIIHTDPLRVAKSHEDVKGVMFDMNKPHWLTVLVQESDILPSSLPIVGIDLTQRLYEEWLKVSPERAELLLVPANRINFLKRQALFSTPGSYELGIHSLIESQIQALSENV